MIFCDKPVTTPTGETLKCDRPKNHPDFCDYLYPNRETARTSLDDVISDLKRITAEMPPPVVMRIECPAWVVNQILSRFKPVVKKTAFNPGIEAIRNEDYGRMWRLTYTDGSISMLDPATNLYYRARDWQ